MEQTPKNGKAFQSFRRHTPRLSERKKKLFANEKVEIDFENDLGVTPLNQNEETRQSRRNIGDEFSDCQPEVVDDKIPDAGTEDQLEQLFSNSMNLGTNQQRSLRSSNKRQQELSNSPTQQSPVAKRHKTNSPEYSISTRRFYKTSPEANSGGKNALRDVSKNMLYDDNVNKSAKMGTRRSLGNHPNINRGVRHKIRKSNRSNMPSLDINQILKNLRNERLQNLIRNERETKEQIQVVHSILRSNKDPIAMARPLTAILNSNDDNNNNAEGDIAPSYMAVSTADFSDIDSSDDSGSDKDDLEATAENDQMQVVMEPVIPLIKHTDNEPNPQPSNVSVRKFFKSGVTANTPKNIQITDHIKATLDKGKISLKPKKYVKRSKFKIRSAQSNGFAKEQATVNKILEALNTSVNDGDNNAIVATTTSCADLMLMHNDEQTSAESSFTSTTSTICDAFRQRIPYQTDDPVTIEQQHLLLDFLISNNICTEKNFEIFIADPDNHKKEAASIVDSLVEVVQEQNDDFRARLPFNTTDPETIAAQNKRLNFLIEYNICTEETFDIFIASYEHRIAEAEEIASRVRGRGTPNLISDEAQPQRDETYQNDAHCVETNIPVSSTLASTTDEYKENRGKELFPIFYKGRCQPLIQKSSRNIQRSWVGGGGLNQYQIDAGQKSFGAQQCKQCGLVYTVHEPEEEKLHRDYHASQHVMRFKPWINEDVVAYHPQWGSSDGRIIRLTENSHVKRLERLKEVLKIVDKELGFSSYIVPSIFVAFLAICRNQIVGLCLVQPLEKANKFISVDGVDCCTEEVFEAKCGISRIWVSPLHRRMQIASKMLLAVQLNTIAGEEIPFSKIAFSAPTHSGKLFAQTITKSDNFLVYQ